MSKKRSSALKNSLVSGNHRYRLATLNNNKTSTIEVSKFNESTLYTSKKVKTQGVDYTEFEKNHLFHKNITFYRDICNSNDSSLLPFLTSLRKNKHYQHQYFINSNRQTAKIATILAPFQVADKETLNQSFKKQICDLVGNRFRLSKAYYRWHNKSGASVKQGCQFQCSLRLKNNDKNPEKSSFQNTIRPIRHRTVETSKYKKNQLICSRQDRLFTLQS